MSEGSLSIILLVYRSGDTLQSMLLGPFLCKHMLLGIETSWLIKKGQSNWLNRLNGVRSVLYGRCSCEYGKFCGNSHFACSLCTSLSGKFFLGDVILAGIWLHISLNMPNSFLSNFNWSQEMWDTDCYACRWHWHCWQRREAWRRQRLYKRARLSNWRCLMHSTQSSWRSSANLEVHSGSWGSLVELRTRAEPFQGKGKSLEGRTGYMVECARQLQNPWWVYFLSAFPYNLAVWAVSLLGFLAKT